MLPAIAQKIALIGLVTFSCSGSLLAQQPPENQVDNGIHLEGLQTTISADALKEISSFIRGVKVKLARLDKTIHKAMSDDQKNRFYRQTFQEIVVESHGFHPEKIIRIMINRTLHIASLIDKYKIVNAENLKFLAYNATHQLIGQYIAILKLEDGADLSKEQFSAQPMARFGRDYSKMLYSLMEETRALYLEHDVKRLSLEWLQVDLEGDSEFRQRYFAQIKSINETIATFKYIVAGQSAEGANAPKLNPTDYYTAIAAYKREYDSTISAIEAHPPIL
jgi:hypothetical protein